MNIEFLGGASEVGRSAIFLKDEKNILLDYGLKIDNKKAQHPMPAHNVDAYIISHAHLDHCGFSPALYMQNSPVSFGTEPTIEIANILIEDAMNKMPLTGVIVIEVLIIALIIVGLYLKHII